MFAVTYSYLSQLLPCTGSRALPLTAGATDEQNEALNEKWRGHNFNTQDDDLLVSQKGKLLRLQRHHQALIQSRSVLFNTDPPRFWGNKTSETNTVLSFLSSQIYLCINQSCRCILFPFICYIHDSLFYIQIWYVYLYSSVWLFHIDSLRTPYFVFLLQNI